MFLEYPHVSGPPVVMGITEVSKKRNKTIAFLELTA